MCMSEMAACERQTKQHLSLGEMAEKFREVQKRTGGRHGAKELADMADEEELRERAAM